VGRREEQGELGEQRNRVSGEERGTGGVGRTEEQGEWGGERNRGVERRREKGKLG
jgi:hypothetical protein